MKLHDSRICLLAGTLVFLMWSGCAESGHHSPYETTSSGAVTIAGVDPFWQSHIEHYQALRGWDEALLNRFINEPLVFLQRDNEAISLGLEYENSVLDPETGHDFLDYYQPAVPPDKTAWLAKTYDVRSQQFQNLSRVKRTRLSRIPLSLNPHVPRDLPEYAQKEEVDDETYEFNGFPPFPTVRDLLNQLAISIKHFGEGPWMNVHVHIVIPEHAFYPESDDKGVACRANPDDHKLRYVLRRERLVQLQSYGADHAMLAAYRHNPERMEWWTRPLLIPPRELIHTFFGSDPDRVEMQRIKMAFVALRRDGFSPDYNPSMYGPSKIALELRELFSAFFILKQVLDYLWILTQPQSAFEAGDIPIKLGAKGTGYSLSELSAINRVQHTFARTAWSGTDTTRLLDHLMTYKSAKIATFFLPYINWNFQPFVRDNEPLNQQLSDYANDAALGGSSTGKTLGLTLAGAYIPATWALPRENVSKWLALTQLDDYF